MTSTRTLAHATRTLVTIAREHSVDLSPERFDAGMAVLTRLSREVATEYSLTDRERAEVKDRAIGQLTDDRPPQDSSRVRVDLENYQPGDL